MTLLYINANFMSPCYSLKAKWKLLFKILLNTSFQYLLNSGFYFFLSYLIQIFSFPFVFITLYSDIIGWCLTLNTHVYTIYEESYILFLALLRQSDGIIFSIFTKYINTWAKITKKKSNFNLGKLEIKVHLICLKEHKWKKKLFSVFCDLYCSCHFLKKKNMRLCIAAIYQGCVFGTDLCCWSTKG